MTGYCCAGGYCKTAVPPDAAAAADDNDFLLVLHSQVVVGVVEAAVGFSSSQRLVYEVVVGIVATVGSLWRFYERDCWGRILSMTTPTMMLKFADAVETPRSLIVPFHRKRP